MFFAGVFPRRTPLPPGGDGGDERDRRLERVARALDARLRRPRRASFARVRRLRLGADPRLAKHEGHLRVAERGGREREPARSLRGLARGALGPALGLGDVRGDVVEPEAPRATRSLPRRRRRRVRLDAFGRSLRVAFGGLRRLSTGIRTVFEREPRRAHPRDASARQDGVPADVPRPRRRRDGGAEDLAGEEKRLRRRRERVPAGVRILRRTTRVPSRTIGRRARDGGDAARRASRERPRVSDGTGTGTGTPPRRRQ